jgi:hypothetical protein
MKTELRKFLQELSQKRPDRYAWFSEVEGALISEHGLDPALTPDTAYTSTVTETKTS